MDYYKAVGLSKEEKSMIKSGELLTWDFSAGQNVKETGWPSCRPHHLMEPGLDPAYKVCRNGCGTVDGTVDGTVERRERE